MQDPIVQTKTCRHCQSTFDITLGDMDFYAKISPTFAGQTFQIPTPTLCPTCRQRRRLAFRNERNLYRRTCDASGKQIISIYSPDKPYKVYDQKIWWSDSWDAMDYGRVFDFSKTFTENFRELMKKVPQLGLLSLQNENSDYVNGVFSAVSSYLCFNCDYIEHCLYTTNSNYLKNSLDSFSCINSELLYQCIGCDNCYQCFYCYGCIDCSFCIDCENVTGKTYCIHNKQLTKEEFEKELYNYPYGLYTPSHINDIHARKNKNCLVVRDCQQLEDCRYCWYVYKAKDCVDFDVFGDNSSLIYESIAVGPDCYNSGFNVGGWGGAKDCYYSITLFGCSDCFGCIGLRNKQYCIFNKQYSKEEYETTVAKIIAHMQETPLKTWHASERGEFFHPSLSPFGYNETVAQEYYPCSVIARSPNEVSGDVAIYSAKQDPSTSSGGPLINYASFGYKRSDYESPRPVSDKVIKGSELPETIEEVDESILQYAIQCEVTGKLFRIQPQELVFYRKHHIPLPRKHPDQRHLERLALRK